MTFRYLKKPHKLLFIRKHILLSKTVPAIENFLILFENQTLSLHVLLKLFAIEG